MLLEQLLSIQVLNLLGALHFNFISIIFSLWVHHLRLFTTSIDGILSTLCRTYLWLLGFGINAWATNLWTLTTFQIFTTLYHPATVFLIIFGISSFHHL